MLIIMSKTPHTQERLDALRIITKQHRLHPNCSADNYFAIATADGLSDLEKKARDGFKNADLPEYIYIPETKQLPVNGQTILYALVCGVYSR